MERYRNIRTGQVVEDTDPESVFARSTQWELLVDDEPQPEPEVIYGGLLVKDYEAATAKDIVTMVGAADLEMAQAVLAYEKAHGDRKTVVAAAQEQVDAKAKDAIGTLDREQLNALAVQVGVEKPEDLDGDDAVREAIEAKRAGGTPTA